MKTTKRILIITLVAGFLAGIAGVILKIQWMAYADTLMLASIVLTFSALAGLVIMNLSTIKEMLSK